MMPRSIRASLVLGTTLATLLVLLIAGGYVYIGVRSALWEQFDEALETDIGILMTMTEVFPDKLRIDFEVLDQNDFETASGSTFMQFWIDDRSIYRSGSLQEADLLRFGGASEMSKARMLTLADGREVRAIGIHYTPKDEEPDPDEYEELLDPEKRNVMLEQDLRGHDGTLVLARSTKAVDTILARVQGLLLVLGAIAASVAVLTLWFVIRKNLSPLESLAKRISELRGTDVSTKVELPDAPSEIQPVLDRLNELLSRIDVAMRRERSFSALVAHELRTPVSGLRSTLEVIRTRPRDSHEYETCVDECLAVVQQMHGMVESLLYLFRLESGQIEPRADRVDVNQVVEECWMQMRETIQERDLKTHFDLPSQAHAKSDGGLLGLAVRNILENAVMHSDDGGSVHVELQNHNSEVVLRVTNSGSLVEPDRVPLLFDRFWRADESRQSTGVHAGLGLSVVKKVADLLNCRLHVESKNGEFHVALSMQSL